MNNLHQRVGSIIAGTVIAIFLMATTTLANGKPVHLFLNYLPGTSNWGPQTASAKAIVGVGDGFVQLSVNGLPTLEKERYTVWLVPQEGDGWVKIGSFNVDETHTGDFGWAPADFPYQEYRLIVITVEPEPDTDGKPDARVSLVGHFPNPEAVPAPSTEAAEERPGRLPKTGGILPQTQPMHTITVTIPAMVLPLMLGVLVGLGGWWFVHRRRSQ
jgi:hypothetical protein